MKLRSIALALALLAAPLGAQAKDQAQQVVQIAVASNFAPSLEKLVQLYRAANPAAPEFTQSAGSTGAHFALITRGAPYDLFFAADQARPEKLVASGKAQEQAIYTQGITVLVLDKADAAGADSNTPESLGNLMRGKVIAIADPALAPYGLAAMQSITWAGLDPQNDLDLVYGANVGLAASLFALGTSDGAIVAKSQLPSIKAHRDFYAVEIEPKSHKPVYQSVALISDRAEVRAFYRWVLKSDAASAQMLEDGYAFVEPASAPQTTAPQE